MAKLTNGRAGSLLHPITNDENKQRLIQLTQEYLAEFGSLYKEESQPPTITNEQVCSTTALLLMAIDHWHSEMEHNKKWTIRQLHRVGN